MEIVDILTPARIAIDVGVASKKAVLEELARLGATEAFGFTPAQAFDSLVSRERLGSTGLGNGIAIPHGRVAHLEVMVGALLRTNNPIDFDAIDGAPADLFFALFVPDQTTEEHLAMLAKLAEVFSDQPLVDKLRSSDSTKSIHDLLGLPSENR
ncbi:MAG: PTS system nitrogen regulatory IIA component [Gammaproteobacteria bacterium]|jgi:PTS system nitrogen regulatory IIA component